MTPTFRDKLRSIVPAWLQRGYSDKLLWAISLQIDALADACVAGVKMRFPGLYSYESLAAIGRERRIRRGRTEPSAKYAARLRSWFPAHARRGGPYALLAQLHAYYSPDNFPIHLRYMSGRRFVLNVDGTIDRDYVHPGSPIAQWARWTLFFFTDEWQPEDVTPDIANDLTLIPKEWIAAHPIGKLILMPTGTELWNYHVPPRQWNNHSLWNKPAGTALQI